MNILERFKSEAKKNPQKIVLPEAIDPRMLTAAAISFDQGIAWPTLLGSPQEVKSEARRLDISVEGIEIIEPEKSANLDEYVAEYMRVRKVKERVARRLLRRTLYFAAMMVRKGDAAGMVSGVTSITAAVIRAAGLVIGLKEGISIPSSFFIMVLPDKDYGEDGTLVFADCAVNQNPSAEQLSEIAFTTAQSAERLLGWEPRLAMLSYSTKGSAAGPLPDKMVKATEIIRQISPHLAVDGELQADAALVSEVAARKVKGESPVAGRANVLIFPDLNAANIAYKLTQYLAGAKAYGPILQGLRRPVNDLSRSASVEDIIGVIAITVVQAQAKEV
ncbi:MAG: hypothetical protein AMS15_01610 [Planctomycetes bacterium DG_23]|nr:MAG: hypothetical protein AMS15_01610 [Planctomycetes bacterium DG_23]